MPNALKLAPADEDLVKAVDDAMKDLQGASKELDALYKDEPAANHATPHRDLIKRSRTSFEKHLDQLQVRIDSVNQDIARAAQARDELIARAEAQHREFMHQIEKDLYQIKTLKAAVELALASLAHADGNG